MSNRSETLNNKILHQTNRSTEIMKMILCGNFLFLILVILIKTESLALSLSQSSYYHYKIEHFNPYSHINNNDTFVLRQKLKKPLHQQPEEEQTSPQWKTIDTTNATDNNSFRRRVMVGYGKKPLNESALLATGSMNLVLYNDRTSVNHNQFGRRQALVVRFLLVTFLTFTQ